MVRLGGTGSTTVLAQGRQQDYECGTQGYCSDWERREGRKKVQWRRRRLQRKNTSCTIFSVVM